MTQNKKGISAMKLHRDLGISYNAAWRMKYKLMQVMMERGRGAADKTPFVAAVETTSERSPVRVKLSVVKGFKSSEIKSWSQQQLNEGSHVISDGLPCFNAVTQAGCAHNRIVCGGGRASVEEPQFYWVNTILGNIFLSIHNATFIYNHKSMLSAVLWDSGSRLMHGVSKFENEYEFSKIFTGHLCLVLEREQTRIALTI